MTFVVTFPAAWVVRDEGRCSVLVIIAMLWLNQLTKTSVINCRAFIDDDDDDDGDDGDGGGGDGDDDDDGDDYDDNNDGDDDDNDYEDNECDYMKTAYRHIHPTPRHTRLPQLTEAICLRQKFESLLRGSAITNNCNY